MELQHWCKMPYGDIAVHGRTPLTSGKKCWDILGSQMPTSHSDSSGRINMCIWDLERGEKEREGKGEREGGRERERERER
jgi:hypothetical protein